MLIANLTMPEFEAGLQRTRTIILPFGATEEHGRHLPLSTDTLMAETLAALAAERRMVFVAPAIPYGVCRSSSGHPGTISIRGLTLRALACDLLRDYYRQGLRRFILLSGHAGGTHNAFLLDAGEEMLDRLPEAEIAVVTELDLVRADAANLVETRGDSHAGEIETSRLLHSHPHLVKGTSEREFPDFPKGLLVRDKRSCWPGGVWGDPGKACAEKGRAIETAVLEGLVNLIDRLETTDQHLRR